MYRLQGCKDYVLNRSTIVCLCASRDLILRVTYRCLHRDYSPGNNKRVLSSPTKTRARIRERRYAREDVHGAATKIARRRRICISTRRILSSARTHVTPTNPRSCDDVFTSPREKGSPCAEDAFGISRY